MNIRRLLGSLGLATAMTVTTAVLASPAKAAPKAADLGVTLSGSAAAVRTGEALSYTVAVTNSGPTGTSATRVAVSLDPSLTITRVTAPCTTSSGAVACDLGPLASGSTHTLSVQVSPTAPGTYLTTATADSPQPDPTPANNGASVTTTVTEAPRVATITRAQVISTVCFCAYGVIGGLYLRHVFHGEVVARDGSVVDEGAVNFGSCSADVSRGLASCSYLSYLGAPLATVDAQASYSGTAKYAPSTSTSPPAF